MAADRIHLTNPAPPHCSGCFQQKPQARHIDFNATWDGPALPALAGAVGVVAHHIDELILCEDCVKVAAALIDLQDAVELIKTRARLEEIRDTLLEKVAALEENNQHLRQAVASGSQVTQLMTPAQSSRQNTPQPPRDQREGKPNRARRQSAASKAIVRDPS